MLLAHVPAAVRSYVTPHLHLDGAQPIAELVRHHDVRVRYAGGRQCRDHIPPEELRHYEVLACSPEYRAVRTVLFLGHRFPLRSSA
jgi:hypothetical protein